MTAFERGEFKIFHEPFSAAYYCSEKRRSTCYAKAEPNEEYNPQIVLTKILEYGEKSVFFEDMAYHAASFMNREFVSKFTNKFITRDPKPVISLVNRFGTDFTLETGYEQQHRLFNLAIENGEEPAIVDASNLTEDPEDIVAA